MGYHLSATVARLPVISVNDLSSRVLTILADYADDQDKAEDGMQRGRNSFPSVATLAVMTGKSPRRVQNSLKELRDNHLIQKKVTKRFIDVSGSRGITQLPTCYELNLSMIARLMDVMHTVKIKRLKQTDDNYRELLDAALTFRSDDWDTREWNVDYQPKELKWGEFISAMLWDTDFYYDENPIEDITGEEIDEYTNTYRVDFKEKKKISGGN